MVLITINNFKPTDFNADSLADPAAEFLKRPVMFDELPIEAVEFLGKLSNGAQADEFVNEVLERKITYQHFYWAIVIARRINMHDVFLTPLKELSDRVGRDFTIRGTKYMWPINELRPGTANYRARFRHDIHPYGTFVGTLKLLPSVANSIHKRLEVIKFFRELDLASVFDEMNDEAKLELEERHAGRRDVFEFFTIDVLEAAKNHPEYMRCVEGAVGDGVWSCEKLTRAPARVVGAPVFTTLRTFRERFEKFSAGYLTTSLNPEFAGQTFDWKNVCSAGGAVAAMAMHDFDPATISTSDIDLFVYGANFKEIKTKTNYLIDWFAGPGVHFGVVGSVINVHIVGFKRPIQIISGKAKCASEVILDFDHSQVQFAYYGPDALYNIQLQHRHMGSYMLGCEDLFEILPHVGEMCVVATPEAIEAARSGVTVFREDVRIDDTRIYKAMRRGYHVKYTEKMAAQFDCARKIDEMDHITKATIDSLASTFYIRADETDGMSTADATSHIHTMIRKNTKAVTVTDSAAEVKLAVVYNGNFQADYARFLFSNFRLNQVRLVPKGPKHNNVPVLRIDNRLDVLSAWNIIELVTTTDDRVSITMRVDDEAFIDFIKNTLEHSVIRLFTPIPVSEHILTGDRMTVHVRNSVLDYAAHKGHHFLRMSDGAPMNIREDLTVGSRLQFMFHMSVDVTPERNEAKITLNPSYLTLLKEGKDHILADDGTKIPIDVPGGVKKFDDDDDAEPDPDAKKPVQQAPLRKLAASFSEITYD